MTTLRGRFLLIVAVLFLVRVHAAGAAASTSTAAAVDRYLYCGDRTCQTEYCDPQIPSGGPGDGCEENQSNCPDDCGYCGDSTCNLGFENPSNCSTDCGYCGDEYCNPFFENTSNCLTDCPLGEGGGDDCGDSFCDTENGEDCASCPQDCSEECGICGDSVCSVAEYGGVGSGNQSNCDPNDPWCTYCPEDCGFCNPGFCWPQVCNLAEAGDDLGQCVDCEDDEHMPADCKDYIEDSWCATGWNRSHVCSDWCYTSYDCPYPDFCDAGVCHQ